MSSGDAWWASKTRPTLQNASNLFPDLRGAVLLPLIDIGPIKGRFFKPVNGYKETRTRRIMN